MNRSFNNIEALIFFVKQKCELCLDTKKKRERERENNNDKDFVESNSNDEKTRQRMK